jgi:hypothetical protein
MKQVTLISLYGQKAKPLAGLIGGCTTIIQSSKLRRIFSPYHLNQIHGTIAGMEKLVGYADHFNANIWANSPLGKRVGMKFDSLVNTVQQHLPITIQFGGFNKAFNAFDSFGKWPYERSFQVQWATNRFTIIGWPHQSSDFTSARLLEILRGEIGEKCNIQHRYSKDNDLFMVLGEISGLHLLSDSELADMKIAANDVEAQVRDYLTTQKVDVEIGAEQVFVAQYEKETLPLESTNVYSVADSRTTGSFIETLYH